MGDDGDGQLRIALAWTDAAAVGLWLWFLNRIVFHHPLAWTDYAKVLGLAVACGALTRRYGRHQGRPLLAALRLLAGQALLAGLLCLLRAAGALHLSPWQVLKLTALQLPVLAANEWLDWRNRDRNGSPFESTRRLLAIGAGLALASVYVTDSWVGSGDAYWYDNMLADFVSQWRAGIFPAFAGQSEYAFNGAVSPLRFAPYMQHFAGVLDLLTGHALGFFALENLTLALAVVGGSLSAYLCAAAILPRRRWTALGLALLYAASPAGLALLYTGNLFMSVTTLPWLPMAVYGLWRWWGDAAPDDDSRPLLRDAAWLALPLAVTWWCHPPIALWLTVVVGGLVAVRLAVQWRRRRRWLSAAVAALLFVLAAGYVFVSVASLATPPTPPIDRMAIIGSIESAVPASFLPVSASVLQISDYQLGWSLWLVIVCAVGTGLARRRPRLLALDGGIVFLLLFLLPVPGITRWLWRAALPQVVCDITFSWAAQRFYVILAAFGTIAGALAFAAGAPRARWIRIVLAVGLAGALGWSGSEALKFVRHGIATTQPGDTAPLTHGAHNLYLTRYSFNIYLPVPGYYSHGYVDPYLENRVLGPDGRTVLASNHASVRPPDSVPPVLLTTDYNPTYHFSTLSPSVTLQPGIRYAARLDLVRPIPSGALVARGDRTLRQYFLPDSAFGMVHAVPTRSFGYLPSSSDFFSLWTSPAAADAVRLSYAYDDPAPATVPSDFGWLRLKPYAVEALPVKITSWMPYRATASVPAGGGWLETPRIFLPGYAARVNGRSARIRRSPDGLVAIALAPGENQVVLRYPGPWLLQAAYGIALLTWATALLAAARSYFGGNPVRRSIT